MAKDRIIQIEKDVYFLPSDDPAINYLRTHNPEQWQAPEVRELKELKKRLIDLETENEYLTAVNKGLTEKLNEYEGLWEKQFSTINHTMLEFLNGTHHSLKQNSTNSAQKPINTP